MEISLENLYVDIGALRVHFTFHSSQGTVGEVLDIFLRCEGPEFNPQLCWVHKKCCSTFSGCVVRKPTGALRDFSRMWDGSEALEISTE